MCFFSVFAIKQKHRDEDAVKKRNARFSGLISATIKSQQKASGSQTVTSGRFHKPSSRAADERVKINYKKIELQWLEIWKTDISRRTRRAENEPFIRCDDTD